MKQAKTTSASKPSSRWLRSLIEFSYYTSAAGQMTDIRHRTRALDSACLVASAFMIPFWLGRGLWDGFTHPTSYILGICCFLLASAPALFRRIQSVELAGLYLTSTTAMVLTSYSYFDGGFYSTAMPWFPILPLFSVLFVGLRWGQGVGVFLLLSLIAMGVLHIYDLVPASTFEPWQTNLLYLLSTSAVLILLIVLANLYTSWQRTIQTELLRANDSKDQFLSGVSHNLRTPLNSILGFSELLQKGYSGDLSAEQREYVDLIHGSGKQLLALVDDLLDISAIDTGSFEFQPEAIGIADIIEGSVSRLQPLAQSKHVEFQVQLQKGLRQERFLLDQKRMRQIMDNLLSNAVKFSPEEGRIDISAQLKNSTLEIVVADQGPGVPKEKREQIFERFPHKGLEVDGTEGTGLGLALSRHIANLHGGTVAVSDRSDQPGCAFKIALPAVPAAEQSP